MAVAPHPPEPSQRIWPAGLAERDVVIVDLETTGGSPAHDRVIEIAALRVRDGRVRERWHTLVNPETTVPPFITGLTGITTGLVAHAPRFGDVAGRFLEFVGDGIVTAHNASFDLGFLRRELGRLDHEFAPAASLCTLKLSRRLLPGLPSHSLEALVRALELPARRSHRALPDALAAADLLARLIEEALAQGLDDWAAIMRLVDGPKRARGAVTYEKGLVRELPAGPGVYLLKDTDENVLYVGKSVNVRTRVQTHLRGKAEGQPRLRRHLRRVANVQAIATETEIEALLLEAQLIKRYLPVANSQLREEIHYPFIRIDVRSTYPQVQLTRTPEDDGAEYIGPFRSARTIGHVVEYVRTVCGIRSCDRPALPDGRACMLLDLKRCLGPCVGAVSDEDYRVAVDRALEMLRGDWEDITLGLEERMNRLADFHEFERAAELRDAVKHLRHLMTPQLRLADLGRFSAVVITPDAPDAVQLYCIRNGRLARKARLIWPAERRRLGPLVRAVYREVESATMSPEAAAEATTVAAWLRQQQKRAGTVVIEIDPSQLDGALKSVRAELDGRAASYAPQPV
jgi:DNA polymerase III subunit epsilon